MVDKCTTVLMFEDEKKIINESSCSKSNFGGQVPSRGEPAVVAVLRGHGQGGGLDQGEAENPAPGNRGTFFLYGSKRFFIIFGLEIKFQTQNLLLNIETDLN